MRPATACAGRNCCADAITRLAPALNGWISLEASPWQTATCHGSDSVRWSSNGILPTHFMAVSHEHCRALLAGATEWRFDPLREQTTRHDLAKAADRADDAAAQSLAKRRQSELAAQLAGTERLFRTCWKKICEAQGENLQAPREIIWLNGPPGAGKGANTAFIKRIRGMTRSITTSDLLASYKPAQELMAAGKLVSDEIVGDALLSAIFNPDDNDGSGIIVDGFPRTGMQVEFLLHLHTALQQLFTIHFDDPEKRLQYPRPSFKVVVLYVDEQMSIARQMRRSEIAAARNKKVVEAGAGRLQELRGTDVDEGKCKARYAVFKEHYPALVKLQQTMPFSIIDATGSLQECEGQIAHELRYQSSLDLDEATYAAVTAIPLAREVVQAARQKLVMRLDGYCHREEPIFRQVLALIHNETLAILRKCSLAGFALFQSRDPIFDRSTKAADMFIDILTDRGFSVSYICDKQAFPKRFDVRTGEIFCETERTHRFRITFEKQEIREVVKSGANQNAQQDPAEGSLLSASVIPEHLDHSKAFDQRASKPHRGVHRAEEKQQPYVADIAAEQQDVDDSISDLEEELKNRKSRAVIW